MSAKQNYDRMLLDKNEIIAKLTLLGLEGTYDGKVWTIPCMQDRHGRSYKSILNLGSSYIIYKQRNYNALHLNELFTRIIKDMKPTYAPK